MEPAPPDGGMYVSNENATLVDVYFDDVKVTHTKSNVIQANEYYPYGLQTANSWTRESTTGNNFLYNGGTELNQTTQVYDLYYRNYDPVLGRFGQVDPMASKYGGVSPYHFAGNNPVLFNDRLGDDYGDNAYLDSWNAYLSSTVLLGSHDTGDPNRMYRGSDPYGTNRGRLLYAIELELASRLRQEYSESTSDVTTIYQAGEKTYLLNPWAGQEGKTGWYNNAWVEMDFSLMATIIFHGYNVRTATVVSYEAPSGARLRRVPV